MEGVHIRLNADEALFTRKELLSAQMNTLELLKRIQKLVKLNLTTIDTLYLEFIQMLSLM